MALTSLVTFLRKAAVIGCILCVQGSCAKRAEEGTRASPVTPSPDIPRADLREAAAVPAVARTVAIINTSFNNDPITSFTTEDMSILIDHDLLQSDEAAALQRLIKPTKKAR